MRRRAASWMWAGFLGLAAGVTFYQAAQSAPRGEDSKADSEKLHPRLLEIAKTYQLFGRVDDEYRWAPYLCREPMPAKAYFSASKESGTHGQKLYSLFVKDRDAYRALGASTQLAKDAQTAQGKQAKSAKKEQPVGQTLVKQSWTPKEVDPKGQALKPVIRAVKTADTAKGSDRASAIEGYDSFLPYARKGGKLYHADRQGDLFIMYKLDPATPGTDKGWVYGTVTPDGKKVTSAGRVASCIKCHEKATSDRLFGLPGLVSLP